MWQKIQPYLHIFNVVVFLLLVGVILYGRVKVSTFANATDQELRTLLHYQIELQVDVNQLIPVKLDIPLSKILNVKDLLPQSIKVNDTVPISETIHLDTKVTVPVNVPLAGTVNVTVPIIADVPVKKDIKINADLNAQNMIVLNDKQVIRINETVPINMTVPVKVTATDLKITQSIRGIHEILNILRIMFLIQPASL